MDVNKLPKWAQEKIRTLEMKLKEAQTQREEVFSGVNGGKKSTVYVCGYNTRPDIHLPEGSTVYFKLKNGEEISAYLSDENRVTVRSNWHPLQIMPEASNTIGLASRRN